MFRSALTSILSSLLLCYLLLPSETAFGADKKLPTKVNFNKTTLARAKAMLDNPANWKKFPNKLNLCVFAPGGSASEATEYAIDLLKENTDFKGSSTLDAANYAIKFLQQNAQFAAATKELGLDLKITIVGPHEMILDVHSKKLNLRKIVNAKLNLYTDERVAAEDFKNKRCDAVGISNLRARQFNSFVGSLDAIGALTSYAQLEQAIKALAKPQMQKWMMNQNYEVTSIIPLGAAYTLVRDRQINSLAKAAGKKVAVLDYDKSQAKMVQNVGAQPVSVDLTNISGKFNNGQVDIMVSPAILFKPLELYKGMTDSEGNIKGGIMRFPLIQLTGVALIQRDRFPPEIGQLVREFTADNLQIAFTIIDQIESNVEAKYWVDVAKADQPGYMKLMRESRINMTKEGYYHTDMMKLLKKVRCANQPTNYECSLNDE